MTSNRRSWLKTSFLATIGASFLPISYQDQLLAQYQEQATLLSNAIERDEAYWTLVKQGFPLEEKLHYFNNASLGPSPTMVATATNKFRALLDSFPSKYMWNEWKPEKDKVREKLASMLKVSTEEIALTHNTTEGMNLIASSLDLKPGDEVILSNHEHHTGTIPWIYHQEQKGVKLVRPDLPLVPSSKEELLDIYRKAITPKTKVISIVHMTNTNGMIMPIKEICDMAHDQGILVAVDGAQTVGMLDLDVAAMGCDFFAGSAHKWLFSPKGLGVFYAKQSAQKYLKPMIVCWGYQDESIRRLENYNTRNMPEVLGMGVAVDYLNLLGAENKVQRIYELKHYFRSQIENDASFKIKTPTDDDLSAGIQTVEVVGMEVKEAQKALYEQHRIDCRPMSSHDLNGLRISLSIFNTKTDVDYLVKALKSLTT